MPSKKKSSPKNESPRKGQFGFRSENVNTKEPSRGPNYQVEDSEMPPINFHIHRNEFFAEKKSDPFRMMRKCDIAAQTQPHFTLLAKDNFTPVLIRTWISMAQQNGTPELKIREAKELLTGIEEWRRQNPLACKIPD